MDYSFLPWALAGAFAQSEVRVLRWPVATAPPTKPLLLLPLVVAVGWYGTRAARHIRQGQGQRRDVLFMLAVCWTPLAAWIAAVLLSLTGSPT
jgi:hypothetical protein